MAIIRYTFSDGTSKDIEVSEEFYIQYSELVQQEKRSHWRETRRHVSLDYLAERNIELVSPDSDPLDRAIELEDTEKLDKALACLSPSQRELLEKVFFDNLPITKIAKAEGVGKSAIANRLARIYEKLKKLLN